MASRFATRRVHASTNRAVEDWRDDAHTDIDRVWYASEFRRLEGVTQVVPPQEDYAFHDRLTHSMKVAQLAATLARKLLYEAKQDGQLRSALVAADLEIEEWIDPDYCYVAGLAHDIGHPPFGHAGEQAIQHITKRRADIPTISGRSFEGNAQSTRIVSSLSFRKGEQRGLNLTLRSMAAIAKYPWERGGHPSSVHKLAKKWSFYTEEGGVLEDLIKDGYVAVERESHPSTADGELGVSRVHRWPEAEIMDWADDISYAVHDLEDFYRAGRIPIHRVAAALNRAPKSLNQTPEHWASTPFEFAADDEEVKAALAFARGKMAGQVDHVGQPLAKHVGTAFKAICDVLLSRMPTNRFDGSRQAHTDLQNFASETIQYLSLETSVVVVERPGELPRLAFRVDPVAQLVAEFFKALCQFYVIETSTLATMQYGQAQSMERLVEGLEAIALRWVERQGQPGNDRTVPARLREYLSDHLVDLGDSTDESEIKAHVFTAVIDFVCGLRDIQATKLEAQLFGDRSSLGMSNTWLDS